MATEVTGDITQITDEDILRRMWQQAEDFSRKKEIRAHMYKIREQRLKDFYTSGEVLRDVQRSNSSPGLREGTPTDGIGKSNTTQSYTKTTQYTRGGESGLTHADSLTDQSFLSLKSKEIRDSESPTRDISYRTQDIVRQGDHDWKILTSKETSEDGKSHLESLIATTAGTREIDGGTNKFAALKEESKFEKNDGDENNFSRTVGGSSKSVAEEHFVSGDDNNYRTSSSKTTSSSSHVVKHFSTKSDEPQITYDRESNFGDDYNERKSTREESRTNYSTNRQVIDNSETDNLYRKNNRYQDESYTNRNDSSNYRQYKQDTSETNRKIIDTNTSQFQHDTTTDKTVEKDGTVVQRVVKIYKSNDPNLPEYAKTNIVDGTTKIVTETRTMPDGSSVTKTKYETVGSKASSDISCAQSNKTSENRRQTEERTSKKYDSRDTTSLRSNKEIDEKTSRKYQQNENDLIDNNIKSTVRITRTQYEDEVDDRSTRNNLRKSDETSTTDNVQIKTSVQSHHIDNTSFNDQNTEFINVERTVDHRKSPDKYTSSKREPESSPPGDEIKVSKEHYKTTYQQEFTNKKISVEVSPQHDAFARSLRTTPDRTSPNRSTKSPSRQDRYGSSDTFTRSQTDITTTRRTTSPQKDSRSSPTRKPSSKESSPSYRQSPDRKPDRYRESPERSMYPSRINEQKTVTSETKRYTKTSKTSPSPERKEDSPRESIYTTDYCTDTIKKRKQITDRESPDRTRKSPRSESPLKYSRDKTSPAKSPSKARSSPTKDFPSKTPSSRESSPNTDTFTRPRKTSPSKETRESSPNTDTFTRPRKTSPSKDFSKEPSPNTDTFTRRGKSSPTKEQPKESSPNTDTFTRPRKSSPSKNDKNSEPKNYRPQPDADEDDIGIKTIKSSRNSEVTQETVTTTVDTKRRTSGGILKNTKRPSEDKPEPEPYQETTIITTDINYVLPNTQIITDLDSNETITITIQPEERPSTLNLEETNYINELIQNERNIEIRNQTTAYSPEPKPIPGKDALISPNPDESAPCEFLVSPKEPEPKSSSPVSPKKDRPLRRKDTYADKCAELLGLVSTKKDSTEIVETSKTTKTKVENTTDFITNEKQNIEKTTNEKEVQRQSPKTSPERKSPSKKSPSKEVPDKSNKGSEVQEFPAQRRSPTSSPERKSPSKTPDISKKSPSKEVPDKTTKGPTVQEFPAQRRSPTSSPERKSPSKTPDVSKKSPSRESPDKSSKGSIQEFPAQRRSPTSSPERKSPSKTLDVSKKSPSPDKEPTVQEFPAQRRSPTSSPERKTSRNIPDDKISPNANKQPNEPYKKTNLLEFPAQKRSPESSPDRKTSTNQEINVTTTNITRKSSLKKPKDTNEAAPTNKQYPTRPYDTSPDRKTSEYSSCDETTVVNRKSSLKKTKIQDSVMKSPTKETPNARQTPDSSPDRQSPQRKSSLKKPKTSVTEFILNEQMIIEQNSKEAAKKIYKSEDITDESDTDSDNEGGDISESESYKYIKNIESEYFPENGIETVLTTKQTTDFNETDFITATVTTETVTSKIDKEIKRPSTPSKIPTKKTPDSSPDRKTNRKTPSNATSPDRKTTTYNLIRNERIQSKQSPESSPDRKTTKKIPVKSPQTTEKKTPATKPLTKQSSNKEIPARSTQPSPDRKAQPSPDRKPVSKTPSRSSIKTPEQPASGKSSPTKFSKSPSDTKRPSISSPTPKATSVSPKTTKTTPSKPLPRRHTDESLTGKTPAKSQPKTKGTVRTVTSTKITKTTSVSPVLKKTMSNIDNKPKKKEPNKATTETESENEEYSDIELNEDGSLITNVSILDAEEFTNDTTTVQNHKTVISETKTYTSDLKINRNGSQKSPVTIKIKPEENTTSKRPSTPSNKIPVRKTPLNKKKPDIKIATKTITLTDTNTEQIVIDIQQSKSSREPSSEHVWPCPVPNDTDTGKPRYPDNVCEPDDQNTKKFKVTDIPLTEGEDVDFNQSKITDVTDEYPENYIPKSIRITDVDKVQETDESLLSVSDKVSKFLHTAEKLTKTSKKDTSTPAPKVTRPELIIDDETLISDECLLSVSDKVNKFLTTAEQLTTTTITSTERPKSPRCRNYEDNEENYIVDETDECLLSVTDKVNRFTTTVEQVASNKRSSDSKPAPKVERPDIIDVNEELREDECLLSVSDKVNKFLTTAEQLTTTTTTTKTTSSIQKETEPKYKPQEKEPTATMRQEPKRQSPIRRPPLVTESEVTTKTTTLTKQLPNENESPKKIYETPKAPRSSEAVRKAKAIFENINNTQQENVNKRNVKTWETKKVSTKDESTKLTDIGVYKKQVDDKKDEVVSMRKESLPKTEITVQRKESLPKTEITSQRKESLSKTTKNIQEDTSLKSTKLILNKPSSTVPTSLDEKPESPVEKYKKLISSKNEVNDYKRPVTPKFETKRPSSPQKPQVNGTVKEDIELTKKKHTPIQETKPRQRSISPLKDTTPRKSIEEPVITKKEISQLEDVSTTKQTKFGVVLKRTDSGRTITTTEQRRRSMSTDPKDPNHQPCIEDIEDLCLLEQMLEKVSGYEQRRRIRAQIRVVKKLIQEGKISSTTTKRTTVSPIRKSPERKILTSKVENTPRQESTEYNEKSYMRQTLTSEKKVNKVTDEDLLQGSTTRTSIDNTTTNFNKKMRSPSPKQRSPSPQYRTPKVTDYSQPTAAWTSRTTTSTTTNIIKKARSPSPKQRSPSPSQQNRPSKVTDYSQPTAAWSLKSTNSRTDFKKIVPKQKPQTDEQPEWVTQKILRKVDRNNTQTTTQTNQRRVTTLSELKSKKDVPKEYESSPSTKDIEPTECITSSYGVGPTDEIGRPLFGLKALRHQSSFNEKTQVRGTVVSSSYYSENGSEPVGEVTVTQYSSDPNELGIDTSRNKQRLHGLAAITTTQKFGRNSPAAVSNTRTTSLKAITTGNKETENNDVTNDVISKTVTSRITRRGSVKEMSKKFIENAVESVQTERKSSYPKAGLILRTSSFKEQIAGSDFDSRASTPGMNEFSKTISLESMESANESKTTRRTDSKTFLNSQTRVTGVQDVISRMKNSTNDSEPGECADDAEARALLNKFLGAQVLMTGMESMMGKQQQSTTVERRSIVTSSKSTSKQESNTPQVSSSISHYTRPVTLADIENIWDESILRLLLTTSTSYEERRIIRARLRQVMAEQEACANIVASMVAETKATELSGMDGTTNTTSTTNRHSIQGESLLLPLLKELLDKQQQQPQNISVAPQNTTTILRTNSSQSSDESGQTSTAIEDSGTESGEDLRLLAAGICDSIEQQRTQNDNRPTTTAEPLGPGLLSEVLSALNRLQTSLQSDSQEVIDPTRKLGLLQLVTRLQASLVPTTVLPPVTTEVKPVEKSSNQSRFAKRKDRKNRHTVGVSSEELADARRLMEEMVLRDTLTNAHTPEDIATPPEFGYAIQKQKSDGSVIPPLSGSNLIKPQYKPVSFNTSAKPFQSESSYAPNVTASEDPYQNHEFPPPIEPLPPSYQIGPPASSIEYNESKNISDEKAQVIQEIQKAALVKQTSLLSEQNEDETFETKLDDDEPLTNNYTTQEHHHEPEINEDVSSVQRLLHIAQDIPNKPLNRFNNKKLRMKRANTIDIPKPINFYQNDDDSDSSIPEYDGKDSATIRKNNYLALRGPIRVSNNASKNTIVPSFEAKTENDKKFLAFIKKHENDTNNHKVTSWMGGINNTQDHSAQPKNHYLQAQNWNNAFGNIKTIFENNSDNSRSSSTTSNSARKFWQTTDDFAMNKKNFHQQVNNNQKPINNTQNIKSLFEQKQEQPKLPWTATNHQEVITGSVKIDPHATSGDQLSVTNVSQRYIPKPIPVNKFSHAPMSAFKPIPKRAPQPVQQPPPPKTPQFSPPVNVTPPRYVTPGTAQSWTYASPKPVSPSNNDSHTEYNQNIKSKIPELAEQFIHPHSKSPTNIVPWAVNSNPNEKRVLALAASKFEQPKIHLRQDEPPKVIHREKVYVPPIIKDVMSGPTTHIDKRYSMHEVPYYEENLTSPKLVQKFEHNKPRKLSEDYQDNNSTNLLKSYNYQPNNALNNSFEPIQYQTKTQSIYQHQNGVNYDLDTDDYSQEVANIQMKNESQNYYETKPPASDSQVNTQANSQEPLKIFDFPSPEPEPEKPNEPEISENSDLTSLSMTEYKAVSKVMKGPVAQSAVTVSQNTPKRREEEMQMANNLKSSLQNFKKQDDNLDQKIKQPATQSKIEKISSPKTHRRSLSNERHKRSNSIGRKLDRQDSKEKKKEKVQNYIKREEKIVKPNVQLTTATFKKLNERGLPYEEPKIQGSAFRRLSADSVIKKDNEIHKMYENPLYSPTTTRSNNMFAAKYEFQKPAPPKVQPKESPQSKPSYHINPIPKYTPKQEPQTNKLFQENKSVPTYPSNQPIQTRPQNNQTRPYPDKNYVGYSSQCVVSNKQYNVPPVEPVRPTLASTNQRQLSTESIEYNEQGESVVTSKLQIPVTKDKFLPQLIPIDKSQPPKIPSPTNLHHHRSDVSWQHIPQHQIPLNKPPSPRGSPRSRYLLQKAKSSHNLAVPTKQFEAGITKDELVQKKKTVEAYFSSSKSPNTLTKTSSQTSMIEKKPTNHSTINRSRMSERISTQSNNFSGGMALSRSRTMPQVVFSDIPLLDEKQVETTKKTVQEGPTTTTEVTTTRITTQRSKPVSPFQKFRQLDKQNSLSSSSSAPNSPMTPGGAGGQPLFKFTDPTLRNSASTVKDRLLYWCQVKTKEYKNVQIENFSTSWADGLAFCALIHHFRPDAFDYDALTPQQRRHNFALAFRVADEIAGIAPLLDVEDMVMMRKPDWKCVFTYVQSIYRRFKDEEI